MKRNITLLVLAACAISATAQTYVKPHVRKDGTYVEGHMRSNPNNTKLDNYSTQGNVNPYSGQDGTVNPYTPPPLYTPPPMPSYGQNCGYTQSGRYVCQ